MTLTGRPMPRSASWQSRQRSPGKGKYWGMRFTRVPCLLHPGEVQPVQHTNVTAKTLNMREGKQAQLPITLRCERGLLSKSSTPGVLSLACRSGLASSSACLTLWQGLQIGEASVDSLRQVKLTKSYPGDLSFASLASGYVFALLCSDQDLGKSSASPYSITSLSNTLKATDFVLSSPLRDMDAALQGCEARRCGENSALHAGCMPSVGAQAAA